jgi:hypothetical protein
MCSLFFHCSPHLTIRHHPKKMALSSWLGYAQIEYTNHKNPIRLRTKAGEDIDLRQLVESVTPVCKLNPFLFNGHLQTAYTSKWKGTEYPVHYKRKLFESENEAIGGSFAVDFVVDQYPEEEHDLEMWPRTSHYSEGELAEVEKGSDDRRPMLISLHGLVGGSHETYLRQVIGPLTTKEAGFAACVLNARGCAKHKVTSPFVFNARATWDIRQLVNWLSEKYPNRPLFAIGYSLGANILTNVSVGFMDWLMLNGR